MSQTDTITAAPRPSGVETVRKLPAENKAQRADNDRSEGPDPFGAITGETAALRYPAMRPVARSSHGPNGIDRQLLHRALTLLDDIEQLEPDDLAVTLESLRNVVYRLWNSASDASVYHRSILANIENYLESHDSVDCDQASALRGAVQDLALEVITEQHAKVVRSQFIDIGQKPLAMFTDQEAAGG